MKASNLIAYLLGAGICASLYACGGHDRDTTPVQPVQQPPGQPQTMMLTVNDVLVKAKVQSETDDPFAVNNAAVSVTPTGDETSDPTSVN